MLRKAAWIWALTLEELSHDKIIETCRKTGIKELFVLVKSISGKTYLDLARSLLKKTINTDIDLHAWIVSFYDKEYAGGPVDPRDEKYQEYLLDLIRKTLKIEADGKTFAGIHLDYIRYYTIRESNDWRTISSFVKKVRELIDSIDPSKTLSMASKAEDYDSKEGLYEKALRYGQNYLDLKQYIDLFIPMTYYLDYNVSPEKAIRAAKWVKELTLKTVYAGIQLHPGEHPETKNKIPSPNDIDTMLRECIKNQLDGACFFRFKLLHDRINEIGEIISKY